MMKIRTCVFHLNPIESEDPQNISSVCIIYLTTGSCQSVYYEVEKKWKLINSNYTEQCDESHVLSDGKIDNVLMLSSIWYLDNNI